MTWSDAWRACKGAVVAVVGLFVVVAILVVWSAFADAQTTTTAYSATTLPVDQVAPMMQTASLGVVDGVLGSGGALMAVVVAVWGVRFVLDLVKSRSPDV